MKCQEWEIHPKLQVDAAVAVVLAVRIRLADRVVFSERVEMLVSLARVADLK
jgi:hypothetical protein